MIVMGAVLGILAGCEAESASIHPAGGGTRSGASGTEMANKPADPVIAKAGEVRILRSELADLVLAGYGRKVLEEYALLLVTREEAKTRRISSGESVMKEEMDRVLEDMAPGTSRDHQERLLRYMLQSRGLSRKEFEMMVERQGLLRRMVEGNVEVTEEGLNLEYERLHGRRVLVRALAAASLRKVEDALRQVKEGADFVQLGREMSEDQRTLAKDGLVGPFSRVETEVPSAIRDAAFGFSQAGKMSAIVTYQDEAGLSWSCVLRLEEVTEADGVSRESVRSELEESARRREIQKRMLALQKDLRSKMNLEIYDPLLLKEQGR